MWKTPLVALAFLAVLPGLAESLDLKNVRPTYGHFGAPRPDSKYSLPDNLYLAFDMEGLSVEAKTGKLRYELNMEVKDGAGKLIFSKKTPIEIIPGLGGDRLPGLVDLFIGRDQPPGKYTLKVQITDKVANQSKEFIHSFEVLPRAFNIIGALAPSSPRVPGEQYVVSFALVDMTLDTAKKAPDVELLMKVVDKGGTKPLSQILQAFPRDLPEDFDVKKENFIPVQFPIMLNRPGEFQIEVDAVDKLGKKRAQLRIPLIVVDPTKLK